MNSSFGMNFGDYLLKETADCIQRSWEPEQRLFRLVSDQFIIADLSGRNIRDAKQLYDRIRTGDQQLGGSTPVSDIVYGIGRGSSGQEAPCPMIMTSSSNIWSLL